MGQLKPKEPPKETRPTPIRGSLAQLVPAVSLTRYDADELVCSQGDPCTDIYYIEEGVVKLTLVSRRGRGAVLGILGRGDFFNEGCLTVQESYAATASATTLVPSSILIFKRRALLRLLEENRAIAAHLMQYLLNHQRRLEEDLIDRIFSSSEKRLARTLLLLDKYGHQANVSPVLNGISQDTLAEMVGTTRSRVNFFMNKFRKLGYIHYEGGAGIKVHSSLQSVLQD